MAVNLIYSQILQFLLFDEINKQKYWCGSKIKYCNPSSQSTILFYQHLYFHHASNENLFLIASDSFLQFGHFFLIFLIHLADSKSPSFNLTSSTLLLFHFSLKHLIPILFEFDLFFYFHFFLNFHSIFFLQCLNGMLLLFRLALPIIQQPSIERKNSFFFFFFFFFFLKYKIFFPFFLISKLTTLCFK